MESILIRLRDSKTAWIYADGLSAEIEEIPFKASSTQGQYLSISLGERKAAVFPFEIFTIDGETFYFGPEPSCHQIVRPSRVKWIRPSDKHTTPIPGMLGVHAIGALVWLTVKCTLRTLRQAGQMTNDAGYPVSHFLMKGCAALTVLTLVILMIKPSTLHAPAPTHDQIAQSKYSIGQIEAARAIRTNLLAEAQSTKDSTKDSSFGHSVTQGSSPKRDGSKKYCKISDQLGIFMSPSQLRDHFKRCSANDD